MKPDPLPPVTPVSAQAHILALMSARGMTLKEQRHALGLAMLAVIQMQQEEAHARPVEGVPV